MLIERDELASGTASHSAAQVTNVGMNQTLVDLRTHSINLNNELQDGSGYDPSYARMRA